jgi:hypothetical protein
MHTITVTPSPQGEVIITRSIWQSLAVDPATALEVRVFEDHIEIHPMRENATSRSTDETVNETEQDVGC